MSINYQAREGRFQSRANDARRRERRLEPRWWVLVEDRSNVNSISFSIVARSNQHGADAEAQSWTDRDAASTEMKRLSSLHPNMTFMLVMLEGMAKSEMATKTSVFLV